MSIPTCTVYCKFEDQTGDPVAGARVEAKLNSFEVYAGYVVPEVTIATTDAAGQCTLDLWPNQLGSVESSYSITVITPGGKRLRVTAVVPNLTSTNLHEITTLPPYPGKLDGQASIEAAQAAGNVALAAKHDAESAAASAATSQTAAAGSATAAATSASASASSATAAAGSATSSATSATASAGSATAASASQTAAASSATAASGSATAAAGSATASAGSATSASASATASAASAASAAVQAVYATLATKNKVLNGNFVGNVRGLTGSVTLGAGARGHDCWQAGASGCTMTGSSGAPTITSGSYKNTIDGALITQTGDHVVSWPGTATCSVNGGASSASPIVVSLTAGSDVTLEFGTGTIGEVQLEEGAVSTRITHLPIPLQRFALDYYVKRVLIILGGGATIAWQSYYGGSSAQLYFHTGSMRAIPSLTLVNNSAVQYFSYSGVWTAGTLTATAYSTGSGGDIMVEAGITADGDGRGKLVRKSTAGDVYAILTAEI